jgi:SPP1 gp7 family putative phage head morphogenesis protein
MMKFILAAPLGRYGDVNAHDVHYLKTALNQLGYYTPPKNTGIEEMREDALFDSLRAFQVDHGIAASDHLIPYDKTVYALDAALKKQSPSQRYIWRTVKDGKTRKAHSLRDGQIFIFSQPPKGGHPGEDYNCRCWVELINEPGTDIYDPPIKPVYPELFIIPALRVGRLFSTVKRILEKLKAQTPHENLTSHGNLRVNQRNITQEEIQEAIKTAKETGNVAIKTGKYNTPQIHYKGSNGITVVQETSGKNAGKIITLWRH